MKFSQREFEDSRRVKLSRFRVLTNCMMLSFSGILLLLPLELIEIATKLTSVLDAIVGIFKPDLEPFQNFFKHLKMKLLGLNEYQLECIDEQRKISILLFENFPFTMLLMAVHYDLIRCDILAAKTYQSTVTVSFISTIINLAINIVEAKFVASFLKENILFYFMNRMAANTRWYPFKQLVQQHNL